MSDSVRTGAECSAVDQAALGELNVTEFQLMTRAGLAAMDAIVEFWPQARNLAVYCGPGNNGGDGYLVAAEAKKMGYHVSLFAFGRPRSDAAGSAHRCALEQGVQITEIGEQSQDCLDPGAELLVDGLFGHGLERDISAPLSDLFLCINASAQPVFALDMPSGINSDTGAVMGVALRAERTACFVSPKIGLLTGAGVDYAGEVSHHSLGIPDRLVQQVPASFCCLDQLSFAENIPTPRAGSHKGDFGHVAIVGGQAGMPGAVILAAMAAARCGAGRVTVVSSEAHVNMIPLACPVLMTRAIGTDGTFDWPDNVSVIVLGPGLGAAAGWSLEVFERTLDYASEHHLPVLVDADALNLLAEHPRQYSQWVLTPHPLEAARLLNVSVEVVQANRPLASRQISERYGGVCVLKGAGSLVTQATGQISVCGLGNWGMATAGSGDVLSGMIGAFMGLGMAPGLAARMGVHLHASAGDLAAQKLSPRAMIASDLIEQIPELL